MRDFDSAGLRREILARLGADVVWKQTPPDIAAVQKLGNASIIELAIIAQKIKKITGAPQNIAWTARAGKFFILRSYFAGVGADVPAPLAEISPNAVIGRIFPGANPPLVASSLVQVANLVIGRILGAEDNRFAADFSGRIYIGAAAVGRQLRRLLKIDVSPDCLFEKKYFSEKLKNSGIAAKFAFVKLAASSLTDYFFAWPGNLRRLGFVKKDVDGFLQSLENQKKLGDILEMECSIYDYLCRNSALLARPVAFPLAYCRIFALICRRWLADIYGDKANAFLAVGHSSVKMMVGIETLWNLSRTIRGDEQLKNLFMEAKSAGRTLRIFGMFPEADLAYKSFMEQSGHRAARETDFSCPRWREDPRFIISILKTYIRRFGGLQPGKPRGKNHNQARDALVGSFPPVAALEILCFQTSSCRRPRRAAQPGRRHIGVCAPFISVAPGSVGGGQDFKKRGIFGV